MEIVSALVGVFGAITAVLLSHALKQGWRPSPGVLPRRYDFRRVSMHLAIDRWRPAGSSLGPFEKGRTIAYAGLQREVDVWDEAVVYAEWVPFKAVRKGWSKTHATSGLSTFAPICPPLLDMDEHRYRISEGRAIHFSLDRPHGAPLIYSTKRLNAFQEGQQDFSIVLDKQRIREVSLSLDLSGALSNAAFVQVPKACVTKGPSDAAGPEIPLSTHYGRTWHLSYRPEASDHRIRIHWQLTEAVTPDCTEYVFGYGSLLSPESRDKTLADYSQRAAVIPAVLRGFRKEWTAYSPNRSGFHNPAEDLPSHIASLNIRQDQEAETRGVLLPVASRDLAELDRRERVYARFDVTQSIVPLAGREMPPDARVLTYVALTPAPCEATKMRPALRRDYLELVQAAARQLDLGQPPATQLFERELLASVEAARQSGIAILESHATPDMKYSVEAGAGQQ
ncbi:MAG: gamma-glutamylcyclotransferase [Candidatus Pacebacteria bacterium]|nr:gamma-glutamylcyclotransferase [Candidatus Paceibacterota bacterium]